MKDIDEIDIEQSEEVPLPDMDPVCYYYYYLNGKGDAGAFPKLVGAFGRFFRVGHHKHIAGAKQISRF